LLVILYEDECSSKIHDFISKNHFTQLTEDITNKLQRHIRTTIRYFSNIIPKDKKHKYINLNPSIPTIRGLLKICKETAPVRLIINWKNAPGYKLAKVLIKILQTHIPLPYAFSVKNIACLISGLAIIPYERDLKLASLDITNMYTNIPTNELLRIIDTACQNSYINGNIKQSIIKLTKTIIDQNCFKFLDTTYVQSEDLAMGAPISSILSEFYLQYLENSVIFNLLMNDNIEGHFRYVDDILIVYNESKTNIDHLLDQFSNLAPKLKFTIEKEVECTINFLDITISRDLELLSRDICRKPAYSDIIIPKDACQMNTN